MEFSETILCALRVVVVKIQSEKQLIEAQAAVSTWNRAAARLRITS
jgi:hypothetical protein